MTLKLNKGEFFTNHIDYLGHALCPGQLKVSVRTTNVVCRLEHPTKLKELQSILGLCNVFLLLIPNFVHVAALLDVATKRSTADIDRLAKEECTTLKTLKVKIIDPQVLSLPRL